GAIGTIPATDIAVINFSYEDQVDFTATGGNNTAFDCEAVVYDNGKLHLFTKNWIGNVMSHYSVSAQPGTHVAIKIETYDTGGLLITSATKANDNIVFLLGYRTSNFTTGLIMISGFENLDNLLVTGNKRNIVLSGGMSANGQIEGIVAATPTRVLISNEHFNPISFINVPQRLYGLNTDQWTPQYVLPVGIYNFTSRVNDNQVVLSWEFDEPGLDYFEVESAENENGPFKAIGKVNPNSSTNTLFNFTDNEPLRSGQRFYRVKIVSDTGRFSYSKLLPVKNSSDTQFNLLLSPNPFNDKINISFYSDKRQTIQFSIIDMQGKIIMTKQLDCTPGRYSYQMGGLLPLSSGVYFLRAQTPSNMYVQRVVR
ncbi:MAG TPA: T9SS type A sorting domain-containing protein, partial [Agriterribacter sp.]|nr:T9SS type A sorting domain-containing protein [Agriterribacter sp.]